MNLAVLWAQRHLSCLYLIYIKLVGSATIAVLPLRLPGDKVLILCTKGLGLVRGTVSPGLSSETRFSLH